MESPWDLILYSPSGNLLLWATRSYHCQALLDSGAEGNFMDLTLAQRLKIPITPLKNNISVSALNGQVNITLTTITLTLVTSGNHTEQLLFFLLDSPLAPIILGHPWLVQHSPRIDWGHNSVSSWSTQCYVTGSVNLSNMPAEYLNLKEVFSKSRAASLPPHRPHDCAIDLLPSKSKGQTLLTFCS